MISTIKANLQRFSIFYDRKFDYKTKDLSIYLIKSNQFLESLLEKAKIHAKEKLK